MCGRNLQKVVCVLSAAIGLMFFASPAAAAVISPLNGSFEGPTVSQPPYYVEGPVDNWARNTTIPYPLEGMYDTYGPARTDTGGIYSFAAGGTGDWQGVMQAMPDWAWYFGLQQDLGTMSAGGVYTFSGTLFGEALYSSLYQISFYNVADSTILESITDADFPVAKKGNPGDVVTASMSYVALAGDEGDVLRLVLAPRSVAWGVHVATGIDDVSVTIPEPGTFALLAAGLLGLLAYAWRKRK